MIAFHYRSSEAEGTKAVDTANDGNGIKAAHNVTNNHDKTGGEKTKSSKGSPRN